MNKRKNDRGILMKALAIPSIFLTTILLLPFLYGCSSVTSPDIDQPELMNMEFTRSQYSADQALILRANPNPDLDPDFLRENPPVIQLVSSSGDETSAQFSPWSHLSDEEMVEAIKDGPGRASVRIKEADKESARNSDGELMRSEEAMNKFKEWIENHDKLSVSRIAKLLPYIFIEFLEEPTVDVVKQIRSHENVEFMEPVQTGEYLSTTNEGASAFDLVSLIIPSSSSFTYRPGDTVTAKFQQSDGSILTASVTITD